VRDTGFALRLHLNPIIQHSNWGKPPKIIISIPNIAGIVKKGDFFPKRQEKSE